MPESAPLTLPSDLTTLSIENLVNGLVVADRWPPPALLHEIFARKVPAAVSLIALIERLPAEDLAAYQAIELLTLLGDPIALSTIATYYRACHEDTIESLGMSLPTFGVAIVPILIPMIGDRSLSWYRRAVAAQVVISAAGDDPELYEQVIETLHTALAAYIDDIESYSDLPSKQASEFRACVSTFAVDLMRLGAERSRPLIRAAVDANIVNSRSVREDDLQKVSPLNKPGDRFAVG